MVMINLKAGLFLTLASILVYKMIDELLIYYNLSWQGIGIVALIFGGLYLMFKN